MSIPGMKYEKSATPDLMPRYNKKDRFDHTAQTRSGRDNKPQIVGNKLGPACHLDSASNASRTGGHLGTGSDSGKEAAASIPSGARAPKVDWSVLKNA